MKYFELFTNNIHYMARVVLNRSKSLFKRMIPVAFTSSLLFLVGLGFFRAINGGYLLFGNAVNIIRAVTWNMAAINNNPFEYWITHEDPIYNNLMKEISIFIQDPGAKDISVDAVFTEEMFAELVSTMKKAGWSGIQETTDIWNNDFRHRKIITQFLKDGLLGKKRLASMPDRMTNTINTLNEGILTRPTVINCYSGDLSTSSLWWQQWSTFMFNKDITIKTRDGSKTVKAVELLTPIRKSKYPAITETEEKISIPLQTLSLAIFDAILVHMMNTIAPKDWQPLREDMCNKLNRKKIDRSIEILEQTYHDSHVIFLQEVAAIFIDKVKDRKLAEHFYIKYPAKLDADRDQNSLILLHKSVYNENVVEVTAEILKEFQSKEVPLEDGDLFAILVTSTQNNKKYLLVSFHGDTNGLATIPVVTAVIQYASNNLTAYKLIFGMDANTYEHPTADQQGVTAFAEFFTSKKLNSCYTQHPNPKNYTTFHARTHLQPQLNKAITLEEKDSKGDKNPKDFILFYNDDFQVLHTHKDNTGKKKYIENMVFPTLAFPSDHGITSTTLKELQI